MISVEQAKSLIIANCLRLQGITISLPDAAGLTLAEDIVAPVDLPPFNQSSMDGYAFAFSDYEPGKRLITGATVPAGHGEPVSLIRGEAVRIFTGAPVPQNADTVVMQENVVADENGISLPAHSLSKGDHVRPRGAEIAKGNLAMNAGTLLTPSAIGYLAGMGITAVQAYGKIRIALLITGNELCKPGTPLAPGQVYESSSFALKAALKSLPAETVFTKHVGDDPDELAIAIREALLSASLVLITGGVSVGDFDFTSRACKQAGVQQVFHRVNQRPGKPLYFGTTGDKPVFGLPGNPSSVLTCFYQYVIPAIEKMSGVRSGVKRLTVPFTGEYRKKTGLSHFLKGRYENGVVQQSGAQESYRLSSFAVSNCLIYVNEDAELVSEGDNVLIYLLNE